MVKEKNAGASTTHQTTKRRNRGIIGFGYAIAVLMIMALTTGCGGGNDKGVVINGVKWATCNTDADGKFVSSPEEIGFNRSFYAIPDSLFPKGWRLPTAEELASLIEAPHKIITRNGVQGMLYGIEPDVIFLPHYLGYGPKLGIYWSSTSDDSGYARTLRMLNPDYVYSDDCYENGSIRLVYNEVTNSSPKQKPTVSSDVNGVVINGVRWATRNVDAPKTFANAPEIPGMFYKWNSKVGWNSVDEGVGFQKWYKVSSSGNVAWTAKNDPSPNGWRIPTISEIHSLCDENKVSRKWTTLNEVSGILFTDKQNGNSIFLPAAGRRHYHDGHLMMPKKWGCYWISHYDKKMNVANHLWFYDESLKLDNGSSDLGQSIRPVAE